MAKMIGLKGWLSTLVGIALLATTGYGISETKRKYLHDLETIKSIFEVKYAPLKWKETQLDWSLKEAIEDAKLSVGDEPTVKECQYALRELFLSCCDYHVGISFFSTESATLPFQIQGAENRYFVTHVERAKLFGTEFPFEVGDEIVTFGGEPIDALISQLRKQEWGNNNFETDQALAELTLTTRIGEMGHRVPKGKVVITGKKSGGEEIEATLSWQYEPEKIANPKHSDLNAYHPLQAKDLKTFKEQFRFFDKMMVNYFWHPSNKKKPMLHRIGEKESYIPALGEKVWDGSFEDFDSYIFLTAAGKKVGYVRIPHYIGDDEEVESFGSLMNFFQNNTDALVIDQIDNPGGSIFYLYALAAILTDHPLSAPKHRIAMTQEEVFFAHALLDYAKYVTDDYTAREIFGDTVGGYPVDYKFVEVMKRFCRFLIAQWEQGLLLTDPIFIFGVDTIQPHPDFQYTKPLLLLVNSLDFSGGDFFPAIMQDNGRATLFGTRTAGAGGYVYLNTFPNHVGIAQFSSTGSIAERANLEPIENLGVQPDIAYSLTANDLQNNYGDYVAAILNALGSIMETSYTKTS
jgi:hypothetical protein